MVTGFGLFGGPAPPALAMARDCMSAWMCFVYKTEPIRNPLEPKPFRDPFEAL